jgi:hypothetical protein
MGSLTAIGLLPVVAEHRIEGGQNGAAAVAEDVPDTLLAQYLDDDLRAREALSSSRVVRFSAVSDDGGGRLVQHGRTNSNETGFVGIVAAN